MRILIVEDEKAVREVFRDLVAGLGHTPLPAESAERALEKLRSDRPDAVLLDVRLPGMSGLSFLDHPAVRASGLPVVVVSGASSEDEARACLQLGALDYIRKPLTLDRLSAVLEILRPYAHSPHRVGAPRRLERRPARRAPIKLAVRLVPDRGDAWTGTCVQISATGMKVHTNARLKPGRVVRVEFTPPDGGPPIAAGALVIRVDKDGVAFWFMDLLSQETQRLTALVERLLLG